MLELNWPKTYWKTTPYEPCTGEDSKRNWSKTYMQSAGKASELNTRRKAQPYSQCSSDARKWNWSENYRQRPGNAGKLNWPEPYRYVTRGYIPELHTSYGRKCLGREILRHLAKVNLRIPQILGPRTF